MRVRAIAGTRIKTNKISTDILCDLLSNLPPILDRRLEILSQAPDISELFGASETEWLKQVVLPGQDNQLLPSELKLLEILKQKICVGNRLVKELARGDKRVKLLKGISGLGPLSSVFTVGKGYMRGEYISEGI